MKILTLIEDHFNELEFFYPYYRVQEDGHEIIVAGSNKDNFKGKDGMNFKKDLSFEEVNVNEFDALLIPGGYAPDQMRKSKAAIDLVGKFNEQNKPIGMICHAAWLGISAGIVKGKTLTSTPVIKDDVVNAGGNWVDQVPVVDHNLVTAQAPKDLPAYTKAFLDLLNK